MSACLDMSVPCLLVQVNKLFTSTPDGDAVPPQAPHILFRNFTGLTAAHGNPVRGPNIGFSLKTWWLATSTS
jgi:hypothetical protein